jgi:hypothetical protein
VEVEMVLGEVGEDGDREADAIRAVLGQRVGGDLHRARGVAGVEHPAERGLQVDRLRGRPLDLLLDATDDALDRPQEPSLNPLRLQDVTNQEGRRRLPVGAGDPGDPEGGGRIAPEPHRDRRHRRPRVGDHHLGNGQLEAALDHQRRGAALDRRGSEVVAVGPLTANTEEERSRSHPGAVVGERGDVRVLIPLDAGEVHADDELAELHHRDCMVVSASRRGYGRGLASTDRRLARKREQALLAAKPSTMT